MSECPPRCLLGQACRSLLWRRKPYALWSLFYHVRCLPSGYMPGVSLPACLFSTLNPSFILPSSSFAALLRSALFCETFPDIHELEMIFFPSGERKHLISTFLWHVIIHCLELQLFGCLCVLPVFLIRISSSHGQYPVFLYILHNWAK